MAKKKLIEKLKKEIIAHEGCVNKVYLDHLGNKTAGVGHLLVDDETDWEVGHKVSEKQVDEWLEADLKTCIEGADKIFEDGGLENEEVALIVYNMTFNLGVAGFGNFKQTIRNIKHKKYFKASHQMLKSLWAKQVPNRANELSDRMRKVGYAYNESLKGKEND